MSSVDLEGFRPSRPEKYDGVLGRLVFGTRDDDCSPFLSCAGLAPFFDVIEVYSAGDVPRVGEGRVSLSARSGRSRQLRSGSKVSGYCTLRNGERGGGPGGRDKLCEGDEGRLCKGIAWLRCVVSGIGLSKPSLMSILLPDIIKATDDDAHVENKKKAPSKFNKFQLARHSST